MKIPWSHANLWRIGVLALGVAASPVPAEDYRVEVRAENLKFPWGLAQLPDGSLLVTTKPGALWRLDATGENRREITGGPEVIWVGQGGLLDVAVSPEFERDEENWIYLSYSKSCAQGFTTAVSRYRLRDQHLEEGQLLFEAQPCSGLTWHFAGRLALDAKGYLFLTVGDRGERHGSQQLAIHHGKVIRLHQDGRVPSDNPFRSQPDALPESWAYGVRNSQGMAWHPLTGELWLHDHGPKGGDELNRVRAGANYGWPLVTFGREYSGLPISEDTEAPGIDAPHWQWTPSIAPSGLAIYDGEEFPAWRGHFLVGALKFQQIHRLEMDAEGSFSEQVLPQPRGVRIRDVRVLSDGRIYVLTDAEDGMLLRLSSASYN